MVAYLEAYRAALAGGDVAEVYPFLGQHVQWWSDGPGGRLRTGLLDTLQGLVDTPATELLPGPFFVEWYWARQGIGYDVDWVHEAVLPPEHCPDEDHCRRLQDLHLSIGPDGIVRHGVRSTVADLRAEGRADEADLERIEARYEEIARRLSSGNAAEAAAMISDRPVWEEGPDGGLVRVNPQEQWTALLEYIFAVYPDARLAPVTTAELGLPGDPQPAVFLIPGNSMFRLTDDTIGGVGVYRQTLVPGQSFLAAFEWYEDATGVIDLDLEVEPGALAASIGSDEPAPMAVDAALWPIVPGPSLRLTGTIEADAGTIDVYNGSASQQALVSWALHRYATAGLPVPLPRSVAFPPSVNCVLHAGLAVDTGAGVDIQLCFDEAETCSGEECAATTDAQSTLLHELGHVWTVEHVDEATRAAFLEVRELEVWSASGVSRDELGTEHAAEILAWALLESDTWPARLPGNDCEDLAAAYRALTGLDPPRGCPQP